jgi:pimeloyl-ACP methyl ester carboxylesterase
MSGIGLRRVMAGTAALAVVVTLGTASTPSAAASQGQIDWGPCTYAPLAGTAVECGRLTVPLDRNDPSGPTVSLMVARHPSEGTADERIGSLLFNPGGPGGSGLQAIHEAWLRLPASVRDRFDLVTWDPRGVGESTPAPADCPLPEFSVPVTYPPDLAAIGTAFTSGMAPVMAACEAANAELASHLGTNESVADLEHLRQAVGDEKLSYLGWSYGTRLGMDYALTYPDRVRAMVLDSPMSPTTDVSSTVEAGLAGTQAFTVFARAYPMVAGMFRAVRAALRVHPLVLSKTLSLDAYSATQYVELLAATEEWFPTLAVQIATMHTAVFGKGAAQASAKHDLDVGLGAAFTNTEPRGWWVGPATFCLDSPGRPTVASLLPVARLLEQEVSPEAAISAVTIAGECAGFSFAPDPVPSAAPGAGPAVPMMIVGSSRDGRTPGAWIQRMADVFPEARTITYRGSQHAVWGAVGSSCVDRPLARFMVTGTVAATDRVCPSTYSAR